METAREHADNTRAQGSDGEEDDSSDEGLDDEEIVEESESEEEDEAPEEVLDDRPSEETVQLDRSNLHGRKSPELEEQVEGLHLRSPTPDAIKPRAGPEGDLPLNDPSPNTRSTEEALPPLPTGKEVLRHLVSNELTRQQAKQKVKYHSKKSGAGRSKGSKAKQDTRVKLNDYW